MERDGGTKVTKSLRPTHKSKTLFAIKALRAVKRITFDKSEASPGETLYVRVPKLNKNEVLVPGSLALRFDIDLSGGHANNFLVQNVSRALVKKMVVKFAGTILQDTADYDLFKIYEDLFLSQEQRWDPERRDPERRFVQDPVKCGRQANFKRRRRKEAEPNLRDEVSHQAGPRDLDRPRRLLPPGSIRRPGV